MSTLLLVNMFTGLALLVALFDVATAGLCWLLWRRRPRPTEPRRGRERRYGAARDPVRR